MEPLCFILIDSYVCRGVMILSISLYRSDQSALVLSWTFDGFKRWLFRAESVVFQLRQSGAKGKWELYLRSVRARHPLCFACLYRSMSRVKVPDEASGEVEENDKQWETGDAPASFKSGMLNHFGFPVSRHEEGDLLLRYYVKFCYYYILIW